MNEKNNLPYYVFLDLDETVISIKSMFSFLKFYCIRFKKLGKLQYFLYVCKLKLLAHLGRPRKQINLMFYRFFCGIDSHLLERSCREWLQENIHENKNFFHSHVLSLIKKHKENAGIPVLVSGSFVECVKPIAEYCGIQHVLAIQLEKDFNKKCTGKILPPQTIGTGKAVAIQEFLRGKNFADYMRCFAYGDHMSDQPMLELVGNPWVVIHAHNKAFEEYARIKGWGIAQAH